jgi:muramoyltetrapeptide carboxypeptidase
MVRPRALRPGSRIAIVSPASPFDRTEFEAGLAELRALGYEPVHDERLFAREPMVSGPARLRAGAFLDALRDPSIDAILAVRGGYGSVEILPYLDAAELRDARKIICGYSDITSLLIYAVCHAGLVAFHGPMIDRRLSRGEAGYDRASFAAALTRQAPMGRLDAPGLSVLKEGAAEGVLIGGTLTQIAAGLGTPYALRPETLGQPLILFIEDVAERPYKLRRMLMQLKLAGILDRVSGVVLGLMTDCDEPNGSPTACEAIASFFEEFRGPVVSGFPSGHGDVPVWTLPLGVRASLTTDGGATLTIDEAAVEG